MKIFVAIFKEDAHEEDNPYVPTLEDAICAKHSDVEFCSEKEKFWEQDDWNIVHVMWPHCFAPYIKEGRDLRKRLHDLKRNGTTLIATVHNLKSHWRDEHHNVAYGIVYSEADVLIHLWSYSQKIMEQQYPQAKSIVIPHHIYDSRYTQPLPSKEAARKYLHYEDGIYALVFGQIRRDDEKELIFKAVSACPDVNFIVPRFMEIPKGKITKRWIKQRLKKIYYCFKYPNLFFSGETFISDEELPMYYALSDISFIQRTDTLNSGNLPLGMYMGHVIVGPNVGNVGQILKETGNFSFDPNNVISIAKAMYDAVKAIRLNKGQENRALALRDWNTEVIADKLYEVYLEFSSRQTK